MSFVVTQPEMLTSAAGELADAGSMMASRNASTAPAITEVSPAAADQVSRLTAAHFAVYGQCYRQLSVQAEAVLERFTAIMRGNADAYALTEAGNAFGTAMLAD